MNTAGKNAITSAELLKTNEDIAPRSRAILYLFVWWQVRAPTIQTLLRPCGAISSLVSDASYLKLASLLMLRGFL